MLRHLEACEDRAAIQARKKGAAARPALHLIVEGVSNPRYWLHLEAGASATLEDLDRFLRDIWLECCGHISAFEIDGVRYASYTEDAWDEEDEETMNKPLSRLLQPGQTCSYEYDYGSTTLLQIRALAQVAVRSGRERIVRLAQNERLDFPCVECGGRPAMQVCIECRFENGGWLCLDCAPEHECGEEMLLPLVNSPRTGVCAYTGD